MSVYGCAQMCGCVRFSLGLCGYVWECGGSARVYTEVSVCVCDESLEYLLETRVLTSADFNTYLIQNFFQLSIWNEKL